MQCPGGASPSRQKRCRWAMERGHEGEYAWRLRQLVSGHRQSAPGQLGQRQFRKDMQAGRGVQCWLSAYCTLAMMIRCFSSQGSTQTAWGALGIGTLWHWQGDAQGGNSREKMPGPLLVRNSPSVGQFAVPSAVVVYSRGPGCLHVLAPASWQCWRRKGYTPGRMSRGARLLLGAPRHARLLPVPVAAGLQDGDGNAEC